MSETLDHPFDEVCARADELIKAGANLYQKFTCENCGNRLTMPDANTFYKHGSCDKCGHVSNIEANGCNYVLTMGVPEEIMKDAMEDSSSQN